jgi:glycosyltransferase involved in cell wall biosynthesis
MSWKEKVVNERELELLQLLGEQERKLEELGEEVRRLQNGLTSNADTSIRLQSDVAGVELLERLSLLEERIGLMRLDRQLRRVPNYLFRKAHSQDDKNVTVESLNADYVVICPVYPGGQRNYGGEFIEERVNHYCKVGKKVVVIEASKLNVSAMVEQKGGVGIVRCVPEMLPRFIRELAPGLLCCHQLEANVWSQIRSIEIPKIVWIHGFECRDWRELEFNFSKKELSSNIGKLEQLNEIRRNVMADVFKDQSILKIFVSYFMKSIGENFVGAEPKSYRIVHNLIDENKFKYHKKGAAERRRILWVRSFSQLNYANDIARDVILELNKAGELKDYEVSIYGDGAYFDECTAPLRKFNNVSINRGFLTKDELVAAHRKNGIMLTPTRWDSQGLTAGEAMGSGLVVASNRVAAIPEFMSDRVALLASAEGSKELAQKIVSLTRDAARFTDMSRKASIRAHRQCGKSNTINVELELMTDMLQRRA